MRRFTTALLLASLALLAWTAAATAAPPPHRVVWSQAGAHGSSSLWTTNAAGTGAARILRDARYPAVAPDGRSVAFVRGTPGAENLHVYRFGHGARLVRGPAPGSTFAQWTPDSASLVWTTPAGRLVVVDVTTRRYRRLVGNVIGGPTLEPGGATVLVTRQTGRRPGGFPARDVFRVHLGSGAATRLTTDGRSLDAVAGPSRIAFSRVLRNVPDGPSTAVWTMLPDGSDRQPLVAVAAGEFGGIIPWRWSASGAQLLGMRPSFVSSEPVAIDPQTGETRDLRPASTDYDLTLGFEPAGEEVLALLRSSDTANGRLVALSYRTGRVLRVYAAKASDASWARSAGATAADR